MNILLIEDNPGDVRIIKEMLSEIENLDFELHVAENLKSGIKTVKSDATLDIILLDLGLPKSRGLDTLNSILNVVTNIPVVILTGLQDTEIAFKAVQKGAQDYLVKGDINKNVLRRVMQYSMERNKLQVKLESVNKLLNSIRDINRLIVQEKNLRSLMKRACESMVKIGSFSGCSVSLFDTEKGELSISVSVGEPQYSRDWSLAEDDMENIPECIRESIVTGEMKIINDLDNCEECSYKVEHKNWKTILLPLKRENKVIGVLKLSVEQDTELSEREKNLLREITSDLAYARDKIKMEMEQKQLLREMKERVKELKCIYGLTESIRKRDTLEEVFQDVANLIPSGWQYPEITRGKVTFDGKAYVSQPFNETEWKQSSEIVVNGKVRGNVEVYYIEERPYLDEGPFLKEERNLINIITRNISEFIERREAERKRKNSLQELKFINDTAIAVSRMDDIDEMCRFLGESVYSVNKETYVIVTLYDPSRGGVRIRSMHGFGKILGKALDILGKDPRNSTFHPEQMEDFQDYYTSGKLERIPDGLYTLTEKKFPEKLITAVEKILGIEGVYTVGFALKDKPVGGIIILTPPKKTVQYKAGIETLANHFAVTVQRIQSEKALKESEEKYRTLVEQSQDAVSIYQDSRFVFVNERLTGLTGYTKDELYEMDDIFKLLHPNDRDKVSEIIQKAVNGEDISENCEVQIVTRSERKIWCYFSVSRITYGGEDAFLIITRDITAEKEKEDEQMRMEKLESLGVLAGGIAHDFNNLLMGIIGNISLAKSVSDNEAVEILEDAEKASRRAKNLTNQLLTFSKGGEPIKEEISIKNVIKESARFILSGSNVQCRFNFSEDLWPVKVDSGQISQVINNLVLNADQAMPEGGKIDVRAENVILEEENSLPLDEGKYVKIEIEDNGSGINEDHLTKIFDPYFSTKSRGSGLGLSSVYSVIKKHDGYIDVESEIGVGTTFSFYLPAVDKKEKARERVRDIEKEKEDDSVEYEGKILLMDDNETVRNVVSKMLEKYGYRVETVRDGEEALRVYKKTLKYEEDPFSAVILDLTISGGMGGKETIKELKEIDPDVKAVVSSGYSTAPVMSNYEKYGFCEVIVKPFDTRKLKETLEKII